MLNINDKVYLHIGDLGKSIDKSNFNKTRLCRIIDIKKAGTMAGEEVGVYTLKAIYDNDKTYTVMSNDNLWKMSSVDNLVDVIKKSKYDANIIAEIIDIIYNS